MPRPRAETELDALGVPHPSPHRERVPMWKLGIPLVVPPVLWLARLSFSYAIIAAACGPTAWMTAGIVNVLSMLVMLAIGIMAQRIWKHGGGEHGHPRSMLLDIGEGRTSFLAHWGVFVSYGFLLVTFFDSIAMLFLPICGQ
jgi:hypothetical protein